MCRVLRSVALVFVVLAAGLVSAGWATDWVFASPLWSTLDDAVVQARLAHLRTKGHRMAEAEFKRGKRIFYGGGMEEDGLDGLAVAGGTRVADVDRCWFSRLDTLQRDESGHRLPRLSEVTCRLESGQLVRFEAAHLASGCSVDSCAFGAGFNRAMLRAMLAEIPADA